MTMIKQEQNLQLLMKKVGDGGRTTNTINTVLSYILVALFVLITL